MLAVLVFEKIVNALLLHQAADEIEVGLPVLNAIFKSGKRSFAFNFGFKVGETAVLEYFLDDRWYFLFLEYPVVSGARQEPQPWPQREPIAEKLSLARTQSLRRNQDAIEHAIWSDGLDFDRAGFAECLVEVDLGIEADCFDVEIEQLAEPLATVKAN